MPSRTLNNLEVIHHVIYEEGRTPPSWDRATYESVINVVPHLSYNVKVEILRNDLGDIREKVSNITFDGVNVGDCKPNEDDYDCTFFDCVQTIKNETISSSDGSITAALTYEGHSWNCDCDKQTWNCEKENTAIALTPMIAVAKLTLTPITGILIKCPV